MMKRSLLPLLLCMSICATAKNNVADVRVPDRNTGTTLIGLGVELDPHFFSQNLTRNDGATAEDWYGIVVPRVQKMGIQRFRVMLLPHWWEPSKGVYTFDSPEVNSLCKVLDLAQSQGIDVVLVYWGAPISASSVDPKIGYIGRYYNCDSKGRNWITSAADPEVFASSYAGFVAWLIKEKGYSCIRELTPYNEPDGGPVCELGEYVKEVKALDAALRREGIRDMVRLNLSDNTDTRRYYLRGVAGRLNDYADLYNSHTYIFGYGNPNSDALEWEKKNNRIARRAGKPHFVGEFGSNLCKGASRQTDINWYRRGVLLVRNAVNFLNGGAAGVSYWSLIDQYYNKDEKYAQMQQLGLWRYKENVYHKKDLFPGIDGDYAVRPHYFAYSLLTRFIRKGDTVYPLDMKGDFIAGTAVLGSDGRWVYVIANGSGDERSYRLTNAHSSAGGICEIYRYQEGNLPKGDDMIAPCGEIVPGDGTYGITVPAQSVLVLRQK